MKKGLSAFFLIEFLLLIYIATPSYVYAQESGTVDPIKNVPAEQQPKDTPKAQGEIITVDPVKNVPVEQQPKDTPKTQGEITADSDQYVIGPEDVLNIFVWREESLTKDKVLVRIDGKISLPLVDDIQAAGLTPLQLKAELTKRLKGFVDNPTVTVTVMEANSFQVYVSGEVKQPGIVRLRSEVTLVKLIIMVGGFTEWANKRKILIITKEKDADKRIIVNYNKIIDGDEPDIVIHRGDTVIVK